MRPAQGPSHDDSSTDASAPELLATADGSVTLRSPTFGEQYHSVHGAVQESLHVFLHHGFHAVPAEALHVLEVGCGTGLNLLLTWEAAMRTGRLVRYTALEPFPLVRGTLQALGHAAAIGRPELEAPFLDAMTGEGARSLSPALRFELRRTPVQELTEVNTFDLVYFDAFGPRTQPEMWTPTVLERVWRAMAPGGILVTYCAKGAVRRTLQATGFVVERLPGPPGKREMLRARKMA